MTVASKAGDRITHINDKPSEVCAFASCVGVSAGGQTGVMCMGGLH